MPDQQTDASAGELVLAAAAAGAKEALGERLIAMYALGSLAHGGFSSIVSDVDLGLILQDPLRESDDAAIRALAESVRAGGTALHERLSVYWGTPASLSGRVAGGRFPALDRLDLIEQGRLLAGEDVRHVVARPSDPELLIAGAEFALEYLGGGPALRPAPAGLGSMSPADERTLDEIRSPMVLVARGPRRVTKVVLFPVRFLFTAATGRVGTNALAVEHYLADADAPARALASAALRLAARTRRTRRGGGSPTRPRTDPAVRAVHRGPQDAPSYLRSARSGAEVRAVAGPAPRVRPRRLSHRSRVPADRCSRE